MQARFRSNRGTGFFLGGSKHWPEALNFTDQCAWNAHRDSQYIVRCLNSLGRDLQEIHNHDTREMKSLP